ncbi:MAG: prepilin-type N-terminal cleavage/methylation domain-containing protein [Thermoanaerobaculia bacterium]
MRRQRAGGFTLIEVLIVVAIIAILAAIAIANYLTALQRARQKRTMADMRTIATAWEARATETRGYSAAGFTFPAQPVTYVNLKSVLVPTYANPLPQADGWATAFEFGTNQVWGTGGALSYGIRSAGADKTFDGTSYTNGTIDRFECDIVYANGSFVTYPSK